MRKTNGLKYKAVKDIFGSGVLIGEPRSANLCHDQKELSTTLGPTQIVHAEKRNPVLLLPFHSLSDPFSRKIYCGVVCATL